MNSRLVAGIKNKLAIVCLFLGLILTFLSVNRVSISNQAYLKRFSGNKSLFQKVLLTFEDDANTLFDQLRCANEHGNKENINSILHTFRGAASTIGALSVAEKLKYMESVMMNKKLEQGTILFENAELDSLEVIIQLSIFKLTAV